MAIRPIYVIGHNINDSNEAYQLIQSGANAIELDIWFKADSPRTYYVSHGEPSSREVENINLSLQFYCQNLVRLMQTKSVNLAMLLIDIKNPIFDVNDLLLVLRTEFSVHFPSIPILLTIAHLNENPDFFKNAQLNANEGVGIDEDNDVVAVEKSFKDAGIQNFGFGDGITMIISAMGPNVFRSMSEAVALQAQGNSFKFNYVWTINDETKLRDYLYLGVQGIITDKIHELITLIHEPALSQRVRMATMGENPFTDPVSPSYILTVKTSDARFSGTDANLSFKLNGTNGSLDTLIDSVDAGMFERGCVNKVVLSGVDLGEIESLEVARDNQGNAPDWELDWVKIDSNLPNFRQLSFGWQGLVPNSGVTLRPLEQYQMEVVTAKTMGAGTDADLSFHLTGELGKAILKSDTSMGKVCEQGETDIFFLMGVDVGKFQALTIKNHGGGLGADWRPESIKVTQLHSGQSHRFNINVDIKENKVMTFMVE